MKMIRNAELKGMKAKQQGYGTWANPYDVHSEQYTLWLRGWGSI